LANFLYFFLRFLKKFSAGGGWGEESGSPKRFELCALFYCPWWIKPKRRRWILEQWI